MRKTAIFLATLASAASALADASTPELSLWITEPIGATDASQCLLDTPQATASETWQKKITQRFTDADIGGWNASGAWKLRRAGISAQDLGKRVADHCFVLLADGTPVVSGAALSTYSARRVRMPVLSVSVSGNAVLLRLGVNQPGVAPSRLPAAYDSIKTTPRWIRRPPATMP